MKTCLFLCTGNYYRSRFAEEYFNHKAHLAGLSWQARSRGLALNITAFRNPGPISMDAFRALRDLGITPSGSERYPQRVSTSDFRQARYVIAMSEREHRPMFVGSLSRWLGKVHFWYIEDMPLMRPEVAVVEMVRNLDRLIISFAASVKTASE